jgi:hypothetical protein
MALLKENNIRENSKAKNFFPENFVVIFLYLKFYLRTTLPRSRFKRRRKSYIVRQYKIGSLAPLFSLVALFRGRKQKKLTFFN